MAKEETVVSASVVFNLYNDAENLLSYSGLYISLYHQMYAKYGSIEVDMINEEDRRKLLELSNTVKVLIYRTYKRAEGLSKVLGVKIPEDMEASYKEIILTQGGRNLTIVYPDDLEKYVSGLYHFVMDTTVRDLIEVSKGIIKDIGV